jgi:hypothetical protein
VQRGRQQRPRGQEARTGEEEAAEDSEVDGAERDRGHPDRDDAQTAERDAVRGVASTDRPEGQQADRRTEAERRDLLTDRGRVLAEPVRERRREREHRIADQRQGDERQQQPRGDPVGADEPERGEQAAFRAVGSGLGGRIEHQQHDHQRQVAEAVDREGGQGAGGGEHDAAERGTDHAGEVERDRVQRDRGLHLLAAHEVGDEGLHRRRAHGRPVTAAAAMLWNQVPELEVRFAAKYGPKRRSRSSTRTGEGPGEPAAAVTTAAPWRGVGHDRRRRRHGSCST